MHVQRFFSFDQLDAMAADWNGLARGVPFRGWDWMSTWWRHYGTDPARRQQNTSLFTLGVFDPEGVLQGIAPWYCEQSTGQGRVVKFLGVEETCGDYLSVLCRREMEQPVTAALAKWLTEANGPEDGRLLDGNSNRWDLLELTGVDAEDRAVNLLVEQLACLGNITHRRAGPNCWRIKLPASWEQYLAMLSKSHRSQLRKLEKRLVLTGRAAFNRVEHPSELPRAEQILIDLHQRRWQSLGEPGCFASERFRAFHHELMPKLLAGGQLHLGWSDIDGSPATAEYHITGGNVSYAYQAGVDPDMMEHSPGTLGNILSIRRMIEQGARVLDFLRGDEPYKAHWRAEPRPGVEYRVAASRPTAQIRHGIWLAGTNVKQWIKTGLEHVTSGS